MSREQASEAIKEWFFQNFEDPVDNTPHETAEGGYLYIWGGPYETRDIIENVFADTASEQLIEEIIGELEEDGSEWVPSSNRREPPENEDWRDWEDVDGEELSPEDAHKKMQERIRELEEALKQVPTRPSGMGHNHPPEPMDPEPLDESDREEIKSALTTLKAQPVELQDTAVAADAFMKLESKRSKLAKWLAQQGLLFTTEAVKEAGKQFGKWAPTAFWLWLMDRMFGVTEAVGTWLHAIHVTLF
jgi:hypothetical protein